MNSATFTFDLFLQKNGCQNLYKKGGGDINEGHIPPPHSGRKSRILAPEDIPDISGYHLGFGRRFVKAYNTENPVTNQKIL